MRLRSHPTRRAPSLKPTPAAGVLRPAVLVAALALAFALSVVAKPAAAGPQECDRDASTIDVDGTRVDGFCFRYSPGRRPSTQGLPEWQRWTIFCESRSFPSYEVGNTVSILFLSEADRDEVFRRSLDPTGTYGIYLVNCDTFGEGNEGSYGYTVVWELAAPGSPSLAPSGPSPR